MSTRSDDRGVYADRVSGLASPPGFMCGRRSLDGGVLRFAASGRCASPPSAAFGKVGDGYVAEVHRWATANGIPVRRSRSFAAASHEAS